MLIADISRSSVLSSQYIEIGLGVLFFSMLIISGKKIPSKIYLFIGVVFLVNLFALVFLGNEFNLIRLAKLSFILIVLPYAAIVSIGYSFWYRFEKVVFLLTLLSLPIFVFNALYSDFFNSLIIYFRHTTAQVFYEFSPNSNYWSAIIYVNSLNEGLLFRNYGFMWEPGAFAMIIIWALVFNGLSNGIKFDLRFIIYSIALFTTFSTAGYFAYFFILSAKYVRTVSIKNIFLFTITIIIFVYFIYQLDFMAGKVTIYQENFSANLQGEDINSNALKVNRFQIFIYDIKDTLKYPFGHGFNYDTEIIGVNGLSTLLKMWGIPIFIYLMVLLRRYFNLYNAAQNNTRVILLFFVSISIMFFSNPVDRSIFFYLLIFTPFTFYTHNTKNQNKTIRKTR